MGDGIGKGAFLGQLPSTEQQHTLPEGQKLLALGVSRPTHRTSWQPEARSHCSSSITAYINTFYFLMLFLDKYL